MRKAFLSVLLACLALSASASDHNLRVVYQGFNFYIPNSPSVIGYLGTNSNILIAKYSQKPGEKVVGFSIDKEVDTGGCDPKAFFKAVLSGGESTCSMPSINAFRNVFIKDRDPGVWSGGDYDFFYFISTKQSTVFVVTDDASREILKIESNFLKEKEIREIFSGYL